MLSQLRNMYGVKKKMRKGVNISYFLCKSDIILFVEETISLHYVIYLFVKTWMRPKLIDFQIIRCSRQNSKILVTYTNLIICVLRKQFIKL